MLNKPAARTQSEQVRFANRTAHLASALCPLELSRITNPFSQHLNHKNRSCNEFFNKPERWLNNAYHRRTVCNCRRSLIAHQLVAGLARFAQQQRESEVRVRPVVPPHRNTNSAKFLHQEGPQDA